MAFPIALAIMGGISAVSGIFQGIQNSQNANAQRKQQQALLDEIKTMTAEQKAMWMQQLQHFESIFGGIEGKLSQYYNNLTPDNLIKQRISDFQKSLSQARVQMNEDLARKGMLGSGAHMAAMQQSLLQQAEMESRIRLNAEDEVAKKQLQFYGLGAQQKSAALGGLNNTYNNAKAYLMAGSNAAGQLANQYSQNAASGFGNAMQGLGNMAIGIMGAAGAGSGSGAKTSAPPQLANNALSNATAASGWTGPSANYYPDYLQSNVPWYAR